MEIACFGHNRAANRAHSNCETIVIGAGVQTDHIHGENRSKQSSTLSKEILANLCYWEGEKSTFSKTVAPGESTILIEGHTSKKN